MGDVTPIPHRLQHGRQTVAAFADTRGDGRALRVTWHHEPAPHGDIVLLSLWRDEECVSSFRLPVDEVPTLIAALRGGLETAYGEVSG